MNLYILPEEWERKIGLLKRRTTKLFQKILNPKNEETRLDGYVNNLIKWLRERFKQSRNQWQQPKVWTMKVKHDEGYTFTEFTIKFYVDDIKLEHCERGSRVSSEVQRERIRQLREAYIYPGLEGIAQSLEEQESFS